MGWWKPRKVEKRLNLFSHVMLVWVSKCRERLAFRTCPARCVDVVCFVCVYALCAPLCGSHSLCVHEAKEIRGNPIWNRTISGGYSWREQQQQPTNQPTRHWTVTNIHKFDAMKASPAESHVSSHLYLAFRVRLCVCDAWVSQGMRWSGKDLHQLAMPGLGMVFGVCGNRFLVT